jgi:hypothetical protein
MPILTDIEAAVLQFFASPTGLALLAEGETVIKKTFTTVLGKILSKI